MRSITDYSGQNNINTAQNAIKIPFLPPIKNRVYTLVLDLDETLVHYQQVYKYNDN